MKTSQKLFVRATEAHSWVEGYDEYNPYDYAVSTDGGDSSYSWVVGEFTVAPPPNPTDTAYVHECRIKGMESVLKTAKAEAYARIQGMEEQLDKMRALPHLAKKEDAVEEEVDVAASMQAIVDDDLPF